MAEISSSLSFEKFKSPLTYFKLYVDIAEKSKTCVIVVELKKQGTLIAEKLHLHPGEVSLIVQKLAERDVQNLGIAYNRISRNIPDIYKQIKARMPKYLSQIITDCEYPILSFSHLIADYDSISNSYLDGFSRDLGCDRFHSLTYVSSKQENNVGSIETFSYHSQGRDELVYCQKKVNDNLELWINEKILQELNGKLQTDEYINSAGYDQIRKVIDQLNNYLKFRYEETEILDAKYEELKSSLKLLFSKFRNKQTELLTQRGFSGIFSLYSPDNLTLDDTETIGLWDRSGIQYDSFSETLDLYKDINIAQKAYAKKLTFHRFLELTFFSNTVGIEYFANGSDDISPQKLNLTKDELQVYVESVFSKIETSKDGQNIYKITNEKEKMRLTPKAELNNEQLWFLQIVNNITEAAYQIIELIGSYIQRNLKK